MLRTLSTCVDRILQENIGYPFESAELCKKLNETIIVRRIVSQIAAIVRESATVLRISLVDSPRRCLWLTSGCRLGIQEGKRSGKKIKEARTNKLKCKVGRRGGDNKKKILKRSMELRGSPAVRRDGFVSGECDTSSPTDRRGGLSL